MNRHRILAWTLPVLALLAAAPACLAAPAISGDYLEARTSDVYTGPCFANSEVNLAGREAVFAWRVKQGAWKGVAIDGLSVVAVVRAAATLGDPTRSPLPAHSVVLVDERADAAQKQALVGLAHEMGGELLSDVVAVESAPITLTVEAASPAEAMHNHMSHATVAALSGVASLTAGTEVELRTRALNHHDHLCGNEEVYYPPLTPSADAVPAVTLAHAFRGAELGETWSSPGKRSAFVGHFER
ncbi:MAG TPA: DUF1326 domain-containing protein [Thermoanaerobaculia bacterium]|jgi:hypothetical protein|nr:DUF1326 domain-containing protein [Thermoanaerobaculia bacterium]